MRHRIGVTAVGSGIGHAIVQSCRLMAEVPYLVGFDASALAFDAYDCDEQHVVPPTRDPSYVETLLRLCVARRVQLLVPGLDHDVALLAAEADRFRSRGVEVVLGGPEFVRLCRDKVAWSRELHAISPAIVPAWTPDEVRALAAAGALPYPLFAKPYEGSGSVGVKILSGPSELAALDASHMVQPFVFPRTGDLAAGPVREAAQLGAVVQAAEVSFQLVYGRGGRLLARMATRNRLKGGVPVEIVPIDDEPYLTALRPVLDHLLARGLRGPVNFQGRMTDDGPRFFEMNGRFTGITAMRALLGFNEVEAAIADFLEIPAQHPQRLAVNHRRVGLRQVVDRVVDAAPGTPLGARVAQLRGTTAGAGGLAVTVTGATGWLGRHLVAALLRDEAVATVTALVRDPVRAAALWPASRRLRVAALDGGTSLVAELAGADLVYHLASARPGQAAAELAESVALTRRMASAAQRTSVPRFVFASSQAVYGVARPAPWSEELPVAPETPYAMAKVAGEELVRLVQEGSPSSRVTSVRFAKLYGAAVGLPWREVPHSLLVQSVAGEPLVIRGGDQIFDLLHLRDAVAALLRFLHAGATPWAPAYNVGGGAPVTLREIARSIMAAARLVGRTPGELRELPGDAPARRFGLDLRLVREQLGWEPAVGLDEGLLELARAAAAARGPAVHATLDAAV